jgi:acetyltransferase-like isoleucine patch superfamily enzyme
MDRRGISSRRFGTLVDNDIQFGVHVTALTSVAISDDCVITPVWAVILSAERLGIYTGNPARLARYRGDRRGE